MRMGSPFLKSLSWFPIPRLEEQMAQITAKWWKEFCLWKSEHGDAHLMIALYKEPAVFLTTGRHNRNHWWTILMILFIELTYEFRRF
jgi:hypothetical protein